MGFHVSLGECKSHEPPSRGIGVGLRVGTSHGEEYGNLRKPTWKLKQKPELCRSS